MGVTCSSSKLLVESAHLQFLEESSKQSAAELATLKHSMEQLEKQKQEVAETLSEKERSIEIQTLSLKEKTEELTTLKSTMEQQDVKHKQILKKLKREVADILTEKERSIEIQTASLKDKTEELAMFKSTMEAQIKKEKQETVEMLSEMERNIEDQKLILKVTVEQHRQDIYKNDTTELKYLESPNEEDFREEAVNLLQGHLTMLRTSITTSEPLSELLSEPLSELLSEPLSESLSKSNINFDTLPSPYEML